MSFRSVQSVVDSIRRREVSAVEVTQTILSRIAKVNPSLRAYSTIDHERALADAAIADARVRSGGRLGPLHGVPVSIKDAIHTKGILTTCGSRAYADYVPDEDAVLVERLRQAGAIVIGKTNTAEFGHLPITDNALFGETRNPWDPSRTSGGSSGGSAAAVAAELGPISIGTDGGGSVRIPAALCGVVGLKPTFGAIPQYPRFRGWDLLGHAGPFGRTVADVRTVMDVLAGPDIRDPDSIMYGVRPVGERRDLRDLRIGWTLSLDEVVAEPAVAREVSAAVRLAAEIGGNVEEVAVDWGDPNQQFRVLVASEMADALDFRDASISILTPTLAKLIEFGLSLSARDYARAIRWRADVTRKIFDWFSRFDLLLLPTCPVEAFAVGSIGPREISNRRVSPFAWVTWTSPFNVTRQPALSIPCGLSDTGLPIGLQIVARYGSDDILLEFAAELEKRVAFADRFHPAQL